MDEANGSGPRQARPSTKQLMSWHQTDPAGKAQQGAESRDEVHKEKEFPEAKVDFQLLIGMADGGIKAWTVDAKKVVCDRSTTAAYSRFL
ncbi:hypothetical protein ACLOJK_010106 [Asimina triloba]